MHLRTRLDRAHRRVWALETAVVDRLLVHNWGGEERRRCECQECIWLRSLISDGLYARMKEMRIEGDAPHTVVDGRASGAKDGL